MELNELINKYSIEEINKKTRIAPDNLEAIFRQDWGYLKKVQTLGFLSILEREYGVDVSTLRQECRSYFESYETNQEPIAISTNQDDTLEEKPRYFIKAIFFISLALLAYGSWYLFVDKNESLESNNTAPRKESLYESVIHLASNWLNPVENETQTEQIDINSSSTIKETEAKEMDKKEESKTQEEAKKSSSNQEQETERVYSKNSSSSADEKIVADVKKQQAKAEEQTQKEQEATSNEAQEAQDEEVITEYNTTTEETQADNKEEAQDKNSDTEESLTPTPPSIRDILPMESSDTNKPKEQKEPVAKETPKEEAKTTQESKKAETKGYKVIIFQPLKKVWLGYTNLTNMKRVAEVTKDSVEFDTSNTSYILATGHGVLQFVDKKGNVLLKMRNGKKNFFLIDNSGVKEISHEEFQRLNKSKVW